MAGNQLSVDSTSVVNGGGGAQTGQSTVTQTIYVPQPNPPVGGNGGNGVTLQGNGSSLDNAGQIRGGPGGGVGAATAAYNLGRAGTGGAGVQINGNNNVLSNSGLIAGGQSGDAVPVQAAAVSVTGNNNTVELLPGYQFQGKVTAAGTNNVLILMDGDNSTGSSLDATQYAGFNSFEKSGASTWTLTGATAAVTPWTILGGTLSISQDATLGSSSGTLTLDGGTLQITGTSLTSLSREIVLGGGGGTISLADPGQVTLPDALSGTGGLTKAGTGVLVLTGENSYTGGTSNLQGILQVGDGGTTGSIEGDVDNRGVLAFDRGNAITFGGVISSGGGLHQMGAGTLTLTGANTYSGGTTISAGTLSVSQDVNLGAPAGVLTLDGGALQVTGTTFNSTSRPIVLTDNGGAFDIANATNTFTVAQTLYGAGGLAKAGAGTLVLSGTNSYQGGTALNGGTLQVAADTNLGAPSGSLMFNGGALRWEALFNLSADRAIALGAGGGTFDTNGFNTAIVQTISGGGGLAKTGSGTLTLNGVNTYSGGTTIAAGTLQGDAASLQGDIANSASLVFDQTGTGSYSDVISGGGTLSKTSAGTLVLNGVNTYTGATDVQAGSLIVGGDAAHATARIAGNVSVDTGATLGGHGTIGGNADVATGAHLAPGNSLGTLTVAGNLTLNTGSQLDFEFGAPGADFSTAGMSDSVAVGGNLTLNGATLNVADAGALGVGVYKLFSYGTLTPGTGNLALGTMPPGADLIIQMLAGDKQIDLVNISGMTLDFWNADGLASGAQRGGGDGTWSIVSANWTDATGAASAAMQPQPGFAIFGGAPGVVKVDAIPGAVAVTGMQFESDGYALTGDMLTLVADSSHSAPVQINVGDGSAASSGWTATIGNVLAGSDGLDKEGAGTLVLTGANTYGGGTTISGGALSVSSDENLGDTANAVTLNGGMLRVTGTAYQSTLRGITLGAAGGGFDIADAGNTFSVNQLLSGTGSLTKAGDGTLVLLQDNSYTGGTSITGGTLQLGTNAALGGVTGNVDVGIAGTLAFDRSDAYTFGGVISGSGKVQQMGTGNLVLTGENTFIGTTVIDAGQLQIGDGGMSGSLAGDIVDNSRLIFNRADDTGFGGVISGAGTLTKLGAGTLALTGDSSAYTGTTQVGMGTLQVDGSLGGQISVNPMTTLSGTGSVGTTTIGRGATLSPGNAATPAATLNVKGDLTFMPGSTYRVDSQADGRHDSVHGTGAANLAGSVVSLGEDGNYAASTSYTILTADSGVHGTFGSVSSNLAFLTPSLAYDAHDVTLQVQLKQVPTGSDTPPSGDAGSAPGTRPIRFADAAVTGNQRAVANGLQSLPASSDLYSRVLNLPNGAPPAVFKALSGEAHASTTTTLQGVTEGVISMPMDHLRANLEAGQFAGPPTAQLGAGDATSLPQSAAQPVWAQVFGNWRTLGGDGNASKVSESDGGLFVGADHAVGGGWRLGGALGYTGSHSTADSVASKADVDSYSATIYGGKAFAAGPGKINLTAGTAYTWNDVRTKRQIGVMGLDQTLKANYGASTGQVFTELGYALPLNERITAEPFLGAAWSDLRTRGFSESGGSAALNGQGNSDDVTTTTLGLHAQTSFVLHETQGHLRGTVGWRHAFGDVTPETTLAFDGGQAFTVAGAPIAHNAAVLELGGDVAVSKNTTVGVAYNGQFGAGNQQNAGSVNVNWRF